METFSALLAFWEGKSTVTGDFPSQRPVTRSFDVFFDLHLSKWLSKPSDRRWFETQSRSLWRHCNDEIDLRNGNDNFPTLLWIRSVSLRQNIKNQHNIYICYMYLDNSIFNFQILPCFAMLMYVNNCIHKGTHAFVETKTIFRTNESPTPLNDYSIERGITVSGYPVLPKLCFCFVSSIHPWNTRIFTII